jgi:hypothetical protein
VSSQLFNCGWIWCLEIERYSVGGVLVNIVSTVSCIWCDYVSGTFITVSGCGLAKLFQGVLLPGYGDWQVFVISGAVFFCGGVTI